MDVDGCVLSAGRAVLDMVEREWQPLSPGELEQRLDQAVEETLEAELVANLRAQQPPTLYVQLLQNQADVSPQVPPPATDGGTQEPADPQEPVGGEALKVPLLLQLCWKSLQKSRSHDNPYFRGKVSSSRWDPVAFKWPVCCFDCFFYFYPSSLISATVTGFKLWSFDV